MDLNDRDKDEAIENLEGSHESYIQLSRAQEACLEAHCLLNSHGIG